MKAIVVSGGDTAPEDAARLPEADLLIAADAGATWVDAIGARPDLVVGDMDSIDPQLLNRLIVAGVTVERHPADKDQSDAELAIARALALGADDVLLLGALGGRRIDHQLANVLMLAHRGWGATSIAMARGATSVRAVQGGGRLALAGAVDDLVTLLPVGGDATGVRTAGLRYPLVGESLALGGTRGLSNQVEKAPASVSLEGGVLLVIETRKEPSQ